MTTQQPQRMTKRAFLESIGMAHTRPYRMFAMLEYSCIPTLRWWLSKFSLWLAYVWLRTGCKWINQRWALDTWYCVHKCGNRIREWRAAAPKQNTLFERVNRLPQRLRR